MKVPEPKKLPSGNWHIKMVLGGENISITRPTAKECKAEAALIKAQHKADRRVKKTDISLKSAIDRYISDRSESLSVETVRGYRVIQRNRFKAYIDKPLASVNWQKAINDELKPNSSGKKLAPKTIENSWGLVSKVLKENGLTVPKVTLPQKITNEHEWLEPEQINVFLEELKGTRCEFPALLAIHGLRRSEIYALTADSFSDDTIHVRGAVVRDERQNLVTKAENKNTSSRRDVPIMIPRLKELVNDGTPMFDVPVSYLTKSINNVCRDAGLPQVGTHGLRHSFCALGIHMGLSLFQIQKLGGWSNTQTPEKIYAHISKRDIKLGADKMKEFFQK